MPMPKPPPPKPSQPQPHPHPQRSGTPQPLEYRAPSRSTPPKTAPPPKPPADPLARFIRPPSTRPRPATLLIGTILIFSVSYYTTTLYNRSTSTSTTSATAPPTHNVPLDVSDRYDKVAPRFDADVRTEELIMWLPLRRRQLTRKAHGDVLEASAGTGRNAKYYDLRKCRSVTMVDRSGPMLAIARDKWRKLHPRYTNVRFLAQSALDPIPSPPGGGYDTVMQTMGLCSTPEPVALLRRLGELVKPEGQILLLEHGRGYFAWLNRVLDRSAPGRADRFGCWHNRDIGRIVEESGLEVVRVTRYNFGTTWWVELRRPRRGEAEKQGQGKVMGGELSEAEKARGRGRGMEEGAGQQQQQQQQSGKRWWDWW